eukprot:12015826-Alexandrium_andersonii.AAC.2
MATRVVRTVISWCRESETPYTQHMHKSNPRATHDTPVWSAAPSPPLRPPPGPSASAGRVPTATSTACRIAYSTIAQYIVCQYIDVIVASCEGADEWHQPINSARRVANCCAESDDCT